MQSNPDSISNINISLTSCIFFNNTFTYNIPLTDLDEITIPSFVNIDSLKLRLHLFFITKALLGFSSDFISFYGSYPDFLG